MDNSYDIVKHFADCWDIHESRYTKKFAEFHANPISEDYARKMDEVIRHIKENWRTWKDKQDDSNDFRYGRIAKEKAINISDEEFLAVLKDDV